MARYLKKKRQDPFFLYFVIMTKDQSLLANIIKDSCTLYPREYVSTP